MGLVSGPLVDEGCQTGDSDVQYGTTTAKVRTDNTHFHLVISPCKSTLLFYPQHFRHGILDPASQI